MVASMLRNWRTGTLKGKTASLLYMEVADIMVILPHGTILCDGKRIKK